MKDAANPWYEVTLIEGKNRQIRRMFEEIGHHVEKIKRVRYGPLTLDVEPGAFRELRPAEVSGLRRAARGDKLPQTERKLPSRTKARDRRMEHGKAKPGNRARS
jgi:23S rRNA pseudouridine2605 synthase